MNRTSFALLLGLLIALVILASTLGDPGVDPAVTSPSGEGPESVEPVVAPDTAQRERAPHATDRRSVLRVISSVSGDPLVAAQVHQAKGRVADVDPKGEVHLQLSLQAEGDLTVRCLGYLPRDVPMRALTEDQVYVVELHPDFRIRGQVVDLAGQAAPEGVTVAAFHGPRPQPAAFEAGSLASGASGHRLVHAQTDAHGAFELRGLEPSLRYSLVAGGAGLISPNAVQAVAPAPEGGEAIQIQVAHTWGVSIRVVGEDGAPLPGSRQLFHGTRGLTTRVMGAHGAHPLPTIPWMALLGLSSDDLQPKIPTIDSERWVLFGRPLNQNPRIHLQWAGPGYRDAALTAELEPIDQGIREVTLEVTQETMGFGSMQVELHGSVLQEATAGEIVAPDLIVELFPQDEPALSRDGLYRCIIPSAIDGVVEIDGIPYGNYQVEIRARNKFWRSPREQHLLQVSHEPASLRVDLEQLGLARIEVLDEDGFPLSVKARVRFHQWQPREGHHAFQYIRPGKNTITMLPPGEYRFYAEAPFPKGYEPVRPEGSIVTVQAQGEVEVNLAFKKVQS